MNRIIMAELEIAKSLAIVREKIHNASVRKNAKTGVQVTPQLVAVSKTKPVSSIIAAYEAGQCHFGENYVKELVQKGFDKDILGQCPTIKWHFIGHLQSNKMKKVLTVPGLYVIETVDSIKIATAIHECWKKLEKKNKLKVMVQVNTSNEEEKNGCSPESALDLVKFILGTCESLELIGFMTIGRFGYDISQGPNPDFLCLRKVCDEVCNALNLPSESMELSMGMSDDFEHAIELGSTNVRVGSLIFGHREKK